MIINEYILSIYLIYNNNIHPAVNCLMNVVINFKKPLVAEQYFTWIKCVYNIYLFIIIIIIIALS